MMLNFQLRKVLEGIEKAHEVGLGPIKVNMVVKKGVNESEILPMVNYFHKTPFILRFIEFMDVGLQMDGILILFYHQKK